MKVKVQLFAALRMAASNSWIEVDAAESSITTIGEIRQALQKQLPEQAELIKRSMFAKGNDYVADEVTVTENDKLACIPPVSGG